MEYQDIGIENPEEFYATKFVYHINADFTNDIQYWYDIESFKRVWFYCNIRPNSRVLDFGCGSGTLSCLKRKGCFLSGIDYSAEGIKLAQEINGYDQGFAGAIYDYDKTEYGTYDYIISSDVFGHITFEDKDPVISELKKYLKKDGCMLHGIECGPIPYDQMSQKEIEDFVKIDGHIGMESRQNNEKRFGKHFKNVDSELRFDCFSSLQELQKQTEQYASSSGIDSILLNYLKTLNDEQVRSYHTALGLVMKFMFNTHIPSNNNNTGFLFLRASDAPLPPCIIETDMNAVNQEYNIRNNNIFLAGWHGVELPPDHREFRWMKNEGTISITDCQFYRSVSFKLGTYNARVQSGEKNCIVYVQNLKEDTATTLTVSKDASPEYTAPIENGKLLLKLYTEDLFIPCFQTPETVTRESRDSRVLSVFLYDLQFHY